MLVDRPEKTVDISHHHHFYVRGKSAEIPHWLTCDEYYPDLGISKFPTWLNRLEALPRSVSDASSYAEFAHTLKVREF